MPGAGVGGGSGSDGAGVDSIFGIGVDGSGEGEGVLATNAGTPSPATGEITLGFPPLTLTFEGPPLAGCELPAAGLLRPPPLALASSFGEPLGEPGWRPSGEMVTREARLPAGIGRFAGASAGVGEIATIRPTPISPPPALRRMSGADVGLVPTERAAGWGIVVGRPGFGTFILLEPIPSVPASGRMSGAEAVSVPPGRAVGWGTVPGVIGNLGFDTFREEAMLSGLS